MPGQKNTPLPDSPRNAREELLAELGNPIEPMAVMLCDDSYRQLAQTLGRDPRLTEAYDAFQGHWFFGVGEQKLSHAEYAVCIVDRAVYNVWDVRAWRPSEKYLGKWVFEGSPSLKLAHLKGKAVTTLNRQYEANSNRLLNID